MRELAAFVMRGPRQAAMVAMVCTLIPMMFWLGAAVVGLVTLRQGIAKGFSIFIWALIPAMGWWLGLKDPSALIVLILTLLMAEVLRATVAWHYTLFMGFAGSVLVGQLLPVLASDMLDMLLLVTEEVFRQMAVDSGVKLDAELQELLRSLLIASIAMSSYAMSLGALFLARSWQSALYNPGGWGQEFHSLRIRPALLASLFAVTLIGPSVGLNGMVIALCMIVPIIMCGLALVHGLINQKKLGGQWLFGFYILVILLFPTFLIVLAAVSVLDSLVDFRSRVQPN